MVSFNLNGETVNFNGDEETPLLWVIRDDQQLTGTKYGCGIAQCGACTVHVNGVTRRACVTPVSMVKDSDVTTIEGVSGPQAEAIKSAWQSLDVPQCGYCQSGQIMSAIALLKSKPSPSDDDIDGAMRGNICRCATYKRIRNAIAEAAQTTES